MNEIELARQQLLEIRVNEMMIAGAMLPVCVVCAVIVLACVWDVKKSLAKNDYDAAGGPTLVGGVAMMFFVLVFPTLLVSANRLIDTYIAPNTIVPGYVAEK